MTSKSFLFVFAAIYANEAVRYVVVTLAWRMVAGPLPGRGWGRVHESLPTGKLNQRAEVRNSLLSMLVFSLIGVALYAGDLWHFSPIYGTGPESPPDWWFWPSIGLAILMHDTLFYWCHRAMHHPLLYRSFHHTHHQSFFPTAFAAYSFQLGEAVVEALMVLAIFFTVPMHYTATLVFQIISLLINAYGHCGREFYPLGMGSHTVGRWINTSSNHAYHHRHGHGNYGFYFMFWDHWMGTAIPRNTRAMSEPRKSTAN